MHELMIIDGVITLYNTLALCLMVCPPPPHTAVSINMAFIYIKI